MAITEKVLGQVKNAAGGTAESLYSPGASLITVVKSMTVCNQSGTADTYRVFLDDDGTTYDTTTAMYYDVAIAADATHTFSVYWPMNDATGNLAVSCATTGAVTFTAFGAEIDV